MTWEIALGVIALFGFVITCATVASKIAAAIGEFKAAVASLGTASITKLAEEIAKIEAARSKYNELDMSLK